MNGVVLPVNATAAGVPWYGDEPLGAGGRRDDDRRLLADGGLELELQLVDVPLGTMIALRPGGADLRPEPLQPRSTRRPGGARLVAGAERVRLDPEVGDEVARDLPRELRVDLRRDSLRRQHRQLRQGSGRSDGGAGDGRLGPRGDTGEHQHSGEDRRAGEGGGTEPVAARPREARLQARRQHIDERPRRADDPESAEQRDLRPELRHLRCDQQHREQGHRERVDVAANPALGVVFGSVIMKKRKIITSGESTTTRQNSKPVIGPRCQRAVI